MLFSQSAKVMTHPKTAAIICLGMPLILCIHNPAFSSDLEAANSLRLHSHAVLAIRAKDGKALISKNASEVRSIASISKVMASLVFMERGLKVEEGTVINREDWGVALDGCRTRLELKWTYRNHDLIHAALLASDNRAVSALGRAVGLNANGLALAMTEKARALELKNTRFVDPVGISPENISTAWEVSRFVRAASLIKVLSEVMGKKDHLVVPMRGYIKVRYRNTNPLVGEVSGVKFLATKTGYNHKAGYCIACVVEVAGVGAVTITILGAKTKAHRIVDLRSIIQWLRKQTPANERNAG